MNARPNIAGLAATGAKALAYQPVLETCDDADWLSELSFADLLDMRDTASDDGDWRGLDEIDHELRTRRADATAALTKLFVEAVNTMGALPWVDGGELTTCKVSAYLHELLGTNAGTNIAVLLILSPTYRAEAIAAMATDYARDNADDLLRAGAEL